MDIQEYKNKVEWYFKEEYMNIKLDEICKGCNELSNELDDLIEVAYKKQIHFPIVARKLKRIVSNYYQENPEEGLN